MQRLEEKVAPSGDPGFESLTRLACVYTTLIGGYEKLNEQPVAAKSRLPFICFTDDPELQSETWQIRRVEPLFTLDPIRSQRVLKLLPHERLPDFDCSIYVDNSVVLKTLPEDLIEEHLGASAFCLPEHSFRNRVLDEFLEVEALGFDDQGRLFEQLNHYALEFPEVLEERPFWTAVLLRDHRDPKVRRMLEIWLAHVQRYSRRDQLSVNLAIKRAGLTPKVLRIDNHESWFHSWPKGNSTRPANFQRFASPFLSHPAARAKELARDNAAKSEQLARLERDLAEERLEREKERLEREKVNARVTELEAALADERSQRATLEGSTAGLTQVVAAERRHREAVELQVAAERRHREAVESQNQALLRSTSWRITTPLRKVAEAVRSLSAIRKRGVTDRSNPKTIPVEQG
jgi:hypothetical protein